MIFQTYYLPSQEEHLLNAPFYRSLCVQPQNFAQRVDPDVRDVEFLKPNWVRQQLCEYTAILAVDRLGLMRNDEWVGFTSWRQFKKGFTFVIDERTVNRVRAGEVIYWGCGTLPQPLSLQAELFHPGIVGVLSVLLRDVHGETIPDGVFCQKKGPFCNYWAMNCEAFRSYVDWSFPIVEEAIRRWGNDQPFDLNKGVAQGHARALAYLQERLFIIWSLQDSHKFVDVTVRSNDRTG